MTPRTARPKAEGPAAARAPIELRTATPERSAELCDVVHQGSPRPDGHGRSVHVSLAPGTDGSVEWTLWSGQDDAPDVAAQGRGARVPARRAERLDVGTVQDSGLLVELEEGDESRAAGLGLEAAHGDAALAALRDRLDPAARGPVEESFEIGAVRFHAKGPAAWALLDPQARAVRLYDRDGALLTEFLD